MTALPTPSGLSASPLRSRSAGFRRFERRYGPGPVDQRSISELQALRRSPSQPDVLVKHEFDPHEKPKCNGYGVLEFAVDNACRGTISTCIRKTVTRPDRRDLIAGNVRQICIARSRRVPLWSAQ